MKLSEIVSVLNSGGLVVLRTDTVYGILARAGNQAAVEKIYSIKGRQSHKPFLQLISDSSQAYDNHGLLHEIAQQYTDRPTSIIIESPSAPFYLLRNGTSIGFRIEYGGELHDIIQQTGALVAPSANPEGLPTARTIEQAKAYFGDLIDLYVDGGEVPASTKPSRIIRINPDGSVEQLR